MVLHARRRVVVACIAASAAVVAAYFLAGGFRGLSGRTGFAKSAGSQRGEPSATYVVRGRVMMVPVTGRPTSEFQVHHEAIPDFKSATGAIGMNSMVMPFPLGDGVSLDGIGPGDPIELTFGVWWTPGRAGYQVLKLRKLPPDTKLDLDGTEGTASGDK